MSQDQKQSDKQKYEALNSYMVSVATVGGQVGCLTVVIIFIALFAGMWLDKTFDSKPMFTLLLVIGSIPVTLFAMFQVVKSTTSRIVPASKTNQTKSDHKEVVQEEDIDSGKTP